MASHLDFFPAFSWYSVLFWQTVLETVSAPTVPCCASVSRGPTVMGWMGDVCVRSPGSARLVAKVKPASKHLEL